MEALPLLSSSGAVDVSETGSYRFSSEKVETGDYRTTYSSLAAEVEEAVDANVDTEGALVTVADGSCNASTGEEPAVEVPPSVPLQAFFAMSSPLPSTQALVAFSAQHDNEGRSTGASVYANLALNTGSFLDDSTSTIMNVAVDDPPFGVDFGMAEDETVEEANPAADETPPMLRPWTDTDANDIDVDEDVGVDANSGVDGAPAGSGDIPSAAAQETGGSASVDPTAERFKSPSLSSAGTEGAGMGPWTIDSMAAGVSTAPRLGTAAMVVVVFMVVCSLLWKLIL